MVQHGNRTSTILRNRNGQLLEKKNSPKSATSCTPIQDDEYAHCITNSRTSQRHFATSTQETHQSNGTPRLQLSRNVQLHIRIVGARDANHNLIRVRHRFRTFVSFFPSVCDAEFSKPFSTSYFNSFISSSSWNFSASYTIRSTSD